MRWNADPLGSATARSYTWHVRLFVAATTLGYIMFALRYTAPAPAAPAPAPAAVVSIPAPAPVVQTIRRPATSCLRLFDMSESRRFWEPPSQHSPTACLGSGLLPQDAQPCLTELRRQRGRPALVAFIGDSRARILFVKFRESLVLPVLPDILHGHFQMKHNATFPHRGRQVPCPASVPMSFYHLLLSKTKPKKFVCYMEALNDLVRAISYWAPFVNAGYPERLAAMEEDCRSGLDCPDLVVMTLGMWYSKFTGACPLQMSAIDCQLHFRNELNKVVPVLQRLSKRTQVVYRIDGPDFREIKFNKSRSNDVLVAVNAVAVETFRRKVPELQVWTSSLAETVRFQQTMCLYLARSVGGPLKVKNRHECMDGNHVGETVRLSAAAAIIRYLCRDTERHPSGHCCAADTGHRR